MKMPNKTREVRDLPESDLHRKLRENGLRVYIDPDVGVTPPEPDFYWSVFVGKFVGWQPVNPEAYTTESSDGSTSTESLTDAIQSAVDEWIEKYGAKKGRKKNR